MTTSIEALRDALAPELASEAATAMVTAFGGPHRCFERFLLSQSMDVEGAASRFRETLTFRKERGLGDGTFKVDSALRERIKPYWPGAISADAPVVFFRVGSVNGSAILSNFTDEEFESFYIAWMEQSLAIQIKANTAAARAGEEPWVGMIEIFDMTGLSPSQLAPSGLAMLSRVLSIGQRHYPENLRKAFIINAPVIFAAGWSVISSSSLSVNTVAKFTITRGDGGDELLDALGGAERLAAVMTLVPPAESWSQWLGMS